MKLVRTSSFSACSVVVVLVNPSPELHHKYLPMLPHQNKIGRMSGTMPFVYIPNFGLVNDEAGKYLGVSISLAYIWLVDIYVALTFTCFGNFGGCVGCCHHHDDGYYKYRLVSPHQS